MANRDAETPARGIFDRHLALWASLAIVVASSLRIYFAAGYDAGAALSILNVVDRTQILVSTLFYLFLITAIISLSTAPVQSWFLTGIRESAGSVHQILATVSIAIVIIIIVASFTPLLLAFLLIGLTLGIVLRTFLRRHYGQPVLPKGEVQGMFNHFFSIAIGLAMVMSLLLPWQTLESLELQGETDPIVGRVMGEQSSQTLILNRRSQVMWVASDDIVSRSFCVTLKPWWQTRLPDLMANPYGVRC